MYPGSGLLRLGAHCAPGIHTHLVLQRRTGEAAPLVLLLVLSGSPSAVQYDRNVCTAGGGAVGKKSHGTNSMCAKSRGLPAHMRNYKSGDEKMKTKITRTQALALLKKYNQEPFHIQHACTVEAVMRWFAEELGYGDQEFWGLCGLLHDVDFEKYPEEHCKKAPELLAEIGAEEELVHAVCSHGYGICVDVEPVHEMEKVLFASDELTGLIGAAARMRPSKSCTDMELSSLKKKFKDKRFAAGCSRDIIRTGAEQLGWDLDRLMQMTLDAMKAAEAQIEAQFQKDMEA